MQTATGSTMKRHQPLSAVITTLNNAETLEACLASLAFADELIVLDSFSTDATQAIAQKHGAVWAQQPFAGYSKQKQAAIDMATHDWVLLLDADEHVTPEGQARIETMLKSPDADAYRLPRTERLFWRWAHPGTRPNWQLRLFRKSCTRMNDVPVHAAPETTGVRKDLNAPFRHDGEASIGQRVAKINMYAEGLASTKAHKPARLAMLVAPPLAFLKFYVGKRYFLNGWAGFIAAKTHAFYAFLKYAKRYEHQRGLRGRDGSADANRPASE